MKIEIDYQLVNKTPEAMQCGVGACPAMYEGVKRVTPGRLTQEIYSAKTRTAEEQNCVWGACPDIQEKDNVYLIIGKLIDPKVAGLEKKVGEGEVLIEVPRDLIDKMEH